MSSIPCVSIKAAVVVTAVSVLVPQTSFGKSSARAQGTTSFTVAQLYTEGDYGRDLDTEMRATVFRLSHRRRDWGIGLTLPYLNISGPALVVFEDVDTGELYEEEVDEKRRGFGDLIVTADRSLWQRRRKGQNVSAGVALKLPTGDESERLSSGETDYSLFIKGRWRKKSNIFSAQFAHQWMGDRDETDYDNRLLLTAGIHHAVDRHWGIGVSSRFKQASLEGREHQRSLSAYVTRKMDKNWRVSLRVGKGFSDSVADFSLGLRLTYRQR